MTTETQLLIYKHEDQHPFATSSIAYKELAKLAIESEKKVNELSTMIEEMRGGFIIKTKELKNP